MKRGPKIAITLWTTDKVERLALALSATFSYTIVGPRLTLDAYFEAYLRGEDHPLPPLNWSSLTPFTHNVLETLQMVPFGKTLTYGELAALMGRPEAARAVGGALGRNPFPLLIPCHRILARGGIGGFSAGLEFKHHLLNYEFLF